MPQAIPAVVGGIGLLQQRKANKDALKASERASAAANQAQAENLAYLKERNAMYDPYRMTGLQGIQNFAEQGGMSAQDAMAMVPGSPVYQAIMAGKQRALDDIDARASVSGGLRSGNLTSDIFNTSQQIDANATLAAYEDLLNRDLRNRQMQYQGYSTLMGVPDFTGSVSGAITGQGNTAAQGLMGQAQTRLAGQQGMMGGMYGLANAVQGYLDNRQPTTQDTTETSVPSPYVESPPSINPNTPYVPPPFPKFP